MWLTWTQWYSSTYLPTSRSSPWQWSGDGVVANLDIYFRFLEDVQDDRCLTLSHLKIQNIKLANAVNMPSSVSSSKFTKGTLSQVDGKRLNSRPQTLSTIIESLPSTSHGLAMYYMWISKQLWRKPKFSSRTNNAQFRAPNPQARRPIARVYQTSHLSSYL